MKRLFLLSLVLLLLVPLVQPAFATETGEETETAEAVEEATEVIIEEIPGADQCGEDMTWSFEDGTLTITGTGMMDDFHDGAPWGGYRDEITEVVISGPVTYIGAYAFQDYDNLTAVDFGHALTEIGQGAFQDCDGLINLLLPNTFKIFGEECFRGCKNLYKIYCTGGFPSFKLNCFWDSYVHIYYPAANPWSAKLLGDLETAFQGRIHFWAYVDLPEDLAEDLEEPTEATEETAEPTEETTEATEETAEATEETTEATEETTEVTEETTEPTVETAEPESVPVQTEPEETAGAELPWDTTEATEEVSEPEEGGSHTGLIMIGGVLAFAVLGFLIFGRKRKGGKFAR